MIHEVVVPLAYDFISEDAYQLLEVLHIAPGQRPALADLNDSDFGDLAVLDDDFSFAFPVVAFPVDVNWFVFPGIEVDDQPEVFVELGYGGGGNGGWVNCGLKAASQRGIVDAARFGGSGEDVAKLCCRQLIRPALRSDAGEMRS